MKLEAGLVEGARVRVEGWVPVGVGGRHAAGLRVWLSRAAPLSKMQNSVALLATYPCFPPD